MSVDLETVKLYLRIDDTEEDAFLGILIETAKEYLKNSGVVESEEKLYELAVMMLVSHWYENREQNISGRITRAIEYGLLSIILQLKRYGGVS